MLARTQLAGTDTLTGLVTAAAARARGVLPGPLTLTACGDVAIDPSADALGLAVEAWLVRADAGAATIAAFAIARGASGGERIAASGRFTFSIPSRERGSAA